MNEQFRSVCFWRITAPFRCSPWLPRRSAPIGRDPARSTSPVVCGGQVVMPGDLLVGDSDGLVVIPRDDAAELLGAVRKNLAMEQDEMKQMKDGTYAEEHHKEIFTGAFLKRGGSFHHA